MTTIEAWFSYEEFLNYMDGKEQIAWATKNKNTTVKLNIPISELTNSHDWGEREGVELNFKKLEIIG